ncbi:uncharacterized protein I206_103892 [Kwoniella pini CBS 10737]|uniref:Uncharacterized protein n=1 Tax=Kwoniella pini CBS 10737 TaxID=1296096 RepID=A0A1B9I3A9_9TREE|nr:uncharacterized protein I206_04535 [Kwoniella pini CBS 10737]OCF50004.1 hypothetical protein I206_04535 [Kwoniella pini CBS 10737]
MSFAYLTATPGLSYNYSLYAIPAGWLIAMVPLWWAAPIANKVSKGSYDNANPKDSWANIDSKPIPLQLKGRIKRAIAAENNTHTNLPLFAAALVAANAAHVDTSSLHFYAGLWLISRIAYTFAYIFIEDRKKSAIRSALFGVGVLSVFALVIKAANKYSSVPW